MSGTFDIPEIINAPRFVKYDDAKIINGMLVYVIQPYNVKYGCMIYRNQGQIAIRFTINDEVTDNIPDIYLTSIIPNLTLLMNTIKLDRMIVYFTDDNLVCDLQLPDKLASPGTVYDLFDKLVGCPKKIDILILDEENRSKLPSHAIIKPSKSRVFELDGDLVPLYVEWKT